MVQDGVLLPSQSFFCDWSPYTVVFFFMYCNTCLPDSYLLLKQLSGTTWQRPQLPDFKQSCTMSYRNTAVAARKEKKAGRVGLTEEQKQEIREAFDLVSSTTSSFRTYKHKCCLHTIF